MICGTLASDLTKDTQTNVNRALALSKHVKRIIISTFIKMGKSTRSLPSQASNGSNSCKRLLRSEKLVRKWRSKNLIDTVANGCYEVRN